MEITKYVNQIKLYLPCLPQYLVYDTQMLLGGRKHQLSPEEHIYGAIQLYMDIIQIFTALLTLFGSNND